MSFEPGNPSDNGATRYGTDDSGSFVICCGERVNARIEDVQAVLTRHRVPLDAQIPEWEALISQCPDPRWAETCIARMEWLRDLDSRRRAVLASVNLPSSHKTVNSPLSELTPWHFQWRGPQNNDVLATLTASIMTLATQGALISSEASQQAAFRRALGYAVNRDECTSISPRVVWMSDKCLINYLVSSLWDDGIIGCAGGIRQKWNTAGQLFVLPGHLPVGDLRGSVCHSVDKRHLIDRCFLDSVRAACGKPAR